MAFSTGYDMGFKFNTDGLGILYISIASIWTLVLTVGCVFLIRHRDLSFLRIRNVPLSIGGVATLHVYLILTMIAYVLNGNFPCSTEFWIMSIYLPLGIALFHASNTQLLHVAMLQKKFAPGDPTDLTDTTDSPVVKKSQTPAWRFVFNRVKTWGPTKRAMILIAIGIAAQFIFALIVFFLSKKFHPSFGAMEWSNKPEHDQEAAFECRRGWEWWPSIAWQFAWTWLYAPYLLYKVRNINDTHGWRMQTIWCCLAGLPASPMWLAALYIPEMAPVSHRFVAPLWFAPSIILMQGFAIFVPCYQVYKNRRLEDNTRQIIAEWEYKKKYSSTYSSDSTKDSSRDSKVSSKRSSIRSTRNPELYTTSSLEKTLHLNPKPLLLFAALKDFSGENISFLTHVLEWKSNWAPPAPNKANVLRKAEPKARFDAKARRQQFNMALRIYSSFVSILYSDFPINISSAHLKELDNMFADAAAKVSKVSAASPSNSFFDFDVEKAPRVLTAKICIPGEMMAYPESNHYNQVQGLKLDGSTDELPDDIAVPTDFGLSVFDHAEASIRELVLTNTWPKFVNAGYANNMERSQLKERVTGLAGHVNGSCSSFLNARLWKMKVKLVYPPKVFAGKDGSRASSSDERTLA